MCKWTLMIAFVLVVMVIYVFLGRATDTLIPAVALPLSLLLTVAVMYMLEFLHQQSDVDGVDTGHRFPGRRRDCVFGKRHAPRRARRIDPESDLQ